MARKHPTSPNQTVLWTWHSLSPAWGSRALHDPQETHERSRGTTKKNSRTTGSKTHANTKKTTPAKITARPSTGRQTTGRNRSQQDATSKNEQVSAGTPGNRPRSPQPTRKNGTLVRFGDVSGGPGSSVPGRRAFGGVGPCGWGPACRG
jgi:hypothetical protein